METLATIGNLISQQETLQQVPYSKETGQRLIKRVLPVMVLDFLSLQEDFSQFLASQEPAVQELFQQGLASDFLIETKNPCAPKLSFSLEQNEAKLLSLSSFSGQCSSFLSLLIADQLVKGQFLQEFTQDELVDMLFLLPEAERNDIQQTKSSDAQLQSLISSLKTSDPEAFLGELQSALESSSRLEKKSDRFIFHPSKLLGTNDRCTISCDESLLQALALITTDEELILDFSALVPQMRQLLCWFFFLKGRLPSIVPSQHLLSLPQAPNALQKHADHYGRETLRMSLLHYGSYDEQYLEKSFDYLKHLRNLFKMLYEQQAFEALPATQLSGKAFRLLSEWSEIADRFPEVRELPFHFAELLSQIQTFTREQFTRYLALSKQEKT